MGPFRDGWTEADIEAVLANGEPQELLYVPIVVSLDPPDWAWSQAICVRLAGHPDANVRGNAILGFGHLARVCGKLDEAVVRPLIESALTAIVPAGPASVQKTPSCEVGSCPRSGSNSDLMRSGR